MSPSVGGRTKTVETLTKEEIPIEQSQGLGCSPLEWLSSCPEEELALANVKIYRYDQGLPAPFLIKLEPAVRIDEDWIGRRFGRGIYGVRVYVKNGKSGFDRNVSIDASFGPPKTSLADVSTPANGAAPAAPAPAAPAQDAAVFNRLADLLERQNDRIERLIESRANPAAPPANPIAEMGFKAALEIMADAQKAAIGMLARPPAEAGSIDRDLERLVKLREAFAPAAAGDGSGSMVAQVTQLGALIDVVEKIRGGRGGEGGGVDWKAMLVEKGLDHIPELVDFGKTLLTSRTKESEELRKREEARRASLEQIARLQQSGAIPAGAPGTAGVQPQAAGPAPGSVQSPAVSPLTVVPLGGQNGEAVDRAVDSQPPVEVLAAQPAAEDPAMIENFLKRRIVQLVAEGDDAAGVLDFIDRSMPVAGAMLSKASERQIRDFLSMDPVLAEITRMPHYEAFLANLVAELQAGGDEAVDTTEGATPKVN